MTPAEFLPFGQGAGLDDLPRSLPALMSMKSMKSLPLLGLGSRKAGPALLSGAENAAQPRATEHVRMLEDSGLI